MKIGCDIVAIDDVQKLVDKYGVMRVLTHEEQAIYNALPTLRKREWFAGRFAAKEAIYKAIHETFEHSFLAIEILKDEDGAPLCRIDGYQIEISIAHDKNYAIAYALAM